jgi:integrase
MQNWAVGLWASRSHLRDRVAKAATLGRWRIWLAEHEHVRKGKKEIRKLGENTIRRHCGRARQFFRAAMKRRLITSNPFGEMKGIRVQANKSRSFFVPLNVAQKVLDACPNAEWRLIFALSRFGGLRCPSEHVGLRWSDIDFAAGKMTIRSPKTEHHEDKDTRVIPIYPELLPYLEDAYELAEPGQEFVIVRYREKGTNLRTELNRIIKRAGVKPWPKPFQNCRSTRQTELAELFPGHVVCAWMGNSEAVAKEHYLQVTDEHFNAASKAAHKAAHSTAVAAGKGEYAKNGKCEFPEENSQVHICTCELVPPRGVEPRFSD